MSYQDPPSTEVVPASGETPEEMTGEEPLIPAGEVIYPQNDPTISDAARDAVSEANGAAPPALKGETLGARLERQQREQDEQREQEPATSDV